jgi:hypothetical protein
LRFTAAQLLEANAEYSYSWETFCPATVRIGPSGQLSTQNQCIFLRGFKLTLREGPMAALKGSAKATPILNAKPSSIFSRGKGSYIPFMNSGQWSSKNSRDTTSGDNHQMMHAPSASPVDDDEVREEVSSEEDVLLESVPSAAEVILPEKLFNFQLTRLLGISPLNRHHQSFVCFCTSLQFIHYTRSQDLQTPEAKAVVMHESDWWDLWDDVSSASDLIHGNMSS